MDWMNLLMNWYRENARDLPWRRTRNAYAIWISEIMLQQTRVAAVIPYYERFMRELPDVYALASVEDDRLHKLWEGLGYYSRARNLKKAAGEIVSRFGGEMPGRYADLISLPGIGEYTAGAIASICFNEAVPAVDGNVLRVYARLFAEARDIRDLSYKKEVREALLPLIPADAPGVFNAALMELGATICLPNGAPKCDSCPRSAVLRCLPAGENRRTAHTLRQEGAKSRAKDGVRDSYRSRVDWLPPSGERTTRGALATAGGGGVADGRGCCRMARRAWISTGRRTALLRAKAYLHPYRVAHARLRGSGVH